MAVVDPGKITEILRECAEMYVLPRYKMLEDHEVSTKTSPNDLVTQADLDVEAHLERVLPDLLPGSIVLGEEGISSGAKNLDALKDSSQKVWIVDPVDGTYNFVHHKREFGIMLAYIVGGETQLGWIYDVLGNAAGVAEKGSGAYFDKARLSVAANADKSQLSGHINPRYFLDEFRPAIRKTREEFGECLSLGCAAHEYLRIAKGEAHFSVYSRLKPWDHLPGALIVEEAGGCVAQWDGAEYRPEDFDVGLIIGNSKDTWDVVFESFLADHMSK